MRPFGALATEARYTEINGYYVRADRTWSERHDELGESVAPLLTWPFPPIPRGSSTICCAPARARFWHVSGHMHAIVNFLVMDGWMDGCRQELRGGAGSLGQQGPGGERGGEGDHHNRPTDRSLHDPESEEDAVEPSCSGLGQGKNGTQECCLEGPETSSRVPPMQRLLAHRRLASSLGGIEPRLAWPDSRGKSYDPMAALLVVWCFDNGRGTGDMGRPSCPKEDGWPAPALQETTLDGNEQRVKKMVATAGGSTLPSSSPCRGGGCVDRLQVVSNRLEWRRAGHRRHGVPGTGWTAAERQMGGWMVFCRRVAAWLAVDELRRCVGSMWWWC